MVRNSSLAAMLLATQRELQQIDSRRAGAPSTRKRLTVPRQVTNRQYTPAWSPRSEVERRPMRVIRCSRDLW